MLLLVYGLHRVHTLRPFAERPRGGAASCVRPYFLRCGMGTEIFAVAESPAGLV